MNTPLAAPEFGADFVAVIFVLPTMIPICSSIITYWNYAEVASRAMGTPG
jgi:hypothetical protein